MELFMYRALAALTFTFLSCAAGAQATREPVSAALLDHFHKAIVKWDNGPVATGAAGTSSMPPSSSQALHEMDFLPIRGQLRNLGTAAQPLAPKVAEQMLVSSKNKYVLAFIITDMTPITPDEAVPESLRLAASGTPADQLVALARLARASSPTAFEALRTAARSGDVSIRLMGTIGLGLGGKAFPEVAAHSVAANLKDQDKSVRSAAANSLRLIGAPAQVVANDLIDYLRTRENVYAATAALRVLPTEALRPVKADLEAIVADPKLTSHMKEGAVDILVRMATAR
jgi:hypothetical protein